MVGNIHHACNLFTSLSRLAARRHVHWHKENEKIQNNWSLGALSAFKCKRLLPLTTKPILQNLNVFKWSFELKYSKPSIIRHSILRQLWSSATNLLGHFAITPASKLPWSTATLTYPPSFALDRWWRIMEGLLYAFSQIFNSCKCSWENCMEFTIKS